MSQPAIEDYALLSNRQSAALIAHGSVDWMCAPRFDSPAVFARLLGTDEHGFWCVRPVVGEATRRAYREGSFVLDTEWSCPTGTLRSTDFLARDQEPGMALVRQVSCTAGTVEVDVRLVLRFNYGEAVPWVRRRRDADGNEVIHALAGAHSLTLHGPLLDSGELEHHGRFTLREGEEMEWVLSWRGSHHDVSGPLDTHAALHHELIDWAEWRSHFDLARPFKDEINDSLAVLRGLTHHSTGGIVAAPTTSLPEDLGGQRNWDYRYTWLRDSAFTIEALASHGHVHSAKHWRDWLLRAIAGDPEDLQVMYALDGERQVPEHVLEHLPGYHDSTPVRIGNGAAVQYQADVVGEVMLALDAVRRAGVAEDRFSWPLQRNLLEFVIDHIDEPDRGIWEIRGEPQFFTHGRVMMWAAFDRAIAAVEEYRLDGDVDAWRGYRDRLADEIHAYGIHAGAFRQHYGTTSVDAALLQIPQTGFVAADSDVMLATVARIEAELMDAHGFVRRYLPDGTDGVPGSEGAFVMCTFWLVEQYARSGRRADAEALMGRLLALRNDVGLLAEEYDGTSGDFLGNFPQAFSHLALIRAAEALA